MIILLEKNMPSRILESNELKTSVYSQTTVSKRDNFTVIVEKGQDGFFVAKNNEIGVVTQSKTLKELESNVIDAIETALEVDSNGKAKEFSITIKKSF